MCVHTHTYITIHIYTIYLTYTVSKYSRNLRPQDKKLKITTIWVRKMAQHSRVCIVLTVNLALTLAHNYM